MRYYEKPVSLVYLATSHWLLILHLRAPLRTQVLSSLLTADIRAAWSLCSGMPLQLDTIRCGSSTSCFLDGDILRHVYC
jgi:hypothetical protein